MSKRKISYFTICLLLLICACFFGCESKTPVDAIYFSEEEITLLVGESYTPKISFSPTYATNQNYILTSSNEQVVTVNSQRIVARGEGHAIIRVISSDNELHEDSFSVIVKKEKSKLQTPQLGFNPVNETFNFNSVSNAVSYTVKINGREINIGNNNTYSLADFDKAYGGAYDRVLDCQVRANAPTYSGAYETSEFSSAQKIYVASAVKNFQIVGGVLSFDSDAQNVYSIKLGDTSFETTSNSIDLTNVDCLAGEFYDVSVVASVGEENKQAGVEYYSSNSVGTRVYAMDGLKPEFASSTARWQALANAGGYDVFIDDNLIATVDSNFVDLSTLAEFEEFDYRPQNYTLRVEPKIAGSAHNIIKSENSHGEILFNRVETPVVTGTNNLITWNKTTGATSYAIQLEYGDIYKTALTDTKFSLDNYPSNRDYNFTLSSLGGLKGDIYYVPSKKAEITIHKQSSPELTIQNRTLKFASSADEQYLIEYSLDGVNPVSTTLTSAGDMEYSLADMVFSAGEHSVFVTHLGNGEEVFDSTKSQVNFIMLEDDATISIKSGEITFSSTEINKDAQISLQIVGATTDFTLKTKNIELNTTNLTGENYLPAGEYDVYAYISGDESKTFGIANSGKASVTKHFKVLPAPELDIASKSENLLVWNEIEDAESYDVFKPANSEYIFEKSEQTNSHEFEIEAQVRFKVQAKGDGESTIDSCLSEELEINKLKTPTLSFDKSTLVISKADSNDSTIVAGYVLTQNGDEIGYDFSSVFNDFVVGNNQFKLVAVGVDRAGNVAYLNSDAFSLNIIKSDATSDFLVDANNTLIIQPKNQDSEHDLSLIITTNSVETALNYAGNHTLKSDDETIQLTYVYRNGQYYIELLNEDFSPKYPIFANNFSVKAKFFEKTQHNVDSNFTIPVLVKVKQTSEVNRKGQNLTISLKSQTHTASDYLILVNNEDLLTLPSNTAVDSDNQLLIFPIEYVYQNMTNVGEINSICAISKNTDSSLNAPTLSSKGENSYFARVSSRVLQGAKDNDSENNSVVLSFDIDTNSYNKSYEISVFNGSLEHRLYEIKLNFENGDARGNKISFNLDDFNLTGEIFVVCKTLVDDSIVQDSKTIMLFNSNNSDAIVKTKVSEVSALYVDNGVLHFGLVNNVAGYEVYRVVGGKQEKLNTNLITTNSYDLSSLTGQATIAVKAIANNPYTNSNLSDTIKVNKLSSPVVSVLAGELAIELSSDALRLFTSSGADITLHVETATKQFDLTQNSDGVMVQSNRVLIEASTLLNYGVNVPICEELKFTLVVNYTENSSEQVYYLNSNTTSFEAYGLFAPTNLQKNSTTSDNNEIVERISFTPNEQNVLSDTDLALGYVFKIEINGKTYLSTDSKLKYFDGTQLAGYPIAIFGNSFAFPYGYDDNGDGTIDEDERFAEGNISISVKTVAKTLAGKNLLNSKFSAPLTFTILPKPVLMIGEGAISWSGSDSAKSYLVRIYESDLTTLKQKDSVIISSFEFNNEIFNDYYGLFGVSVQAISNDQFVVNSAESEVVTVYRLPGAVAVKVDDGNLILNANPYFSKAEISFIDSASDRIETITFDRTEQASAELNKLEIANWTEFDIADINNLYLPRDFVVKGLSSEILNILDNRSYTIDVKLLGNSNPELPIISSKQTKNVSNLVVTKLATSLTEVNKGVIKFDYLGDYSGINLNYNFNNQLAENVSTFWQTARLYKIDINEHTIYAIDFNSFETAISNGTLDASSYELLNDMNGLYAFVRYNYITNGETKQLYFNVYENNTINLREYNTLYYYSITTTLGEGEQTFAGAEDESSLSEIDVANGGSFTISLSLVGGDGVESENRGYLTSNLNTLTTFRRYSENYLTTIKGVLALDDLIIYDRGSAVDYPVYKLNVNPINDSTNVVHVYLYYSSITGEEAKQITGDPDGQYYEIEKSGDKILFDFSKYFEAGSYQVDVQTLAGLGVEGSLGADFVLDAKLPTSNNIVKKISTTTVTLRNGTLQFDMAYVAGDSENLYIDSYEITLIDNTLSSEYIYTISRSSEGVKIGNNKLTYELPASIEVSGRRVELSNNHSYSIKVKALANDNQFIINASYPTLDFNFTRSSGVSESPSESVRISDGKLIYKVLDLNNYSQVVIKLYFTDSNGERQFISIPTNGERVNDQSGNYLYHVYTFGDSRYTIGNNTSVYIDSNIEYTLTVTVLGNSSALINSCPSNGIMVERLKAVSQDMIYSENGVLTWERIPNATKYVVTLTGNETYTFTTSSNIIDFGEEFDDFGNKLVAGEYRISIRPLGDDFINARETNVSTTFKKLASVTGIRIDNNDKNNIVWDAVDGANGYLVEFLYGGKQSSVKTTTASVKVPDDLSGNYQVIVTALYNGRGNTFNADATYRASSKQRPSPVNEVLFDAENKFYYWSTKSDFMPTDKFRLTYKLEEYTYNGNTVTTLPAKSVDITITAEDTIDIDGTNYYCYRPNVMGLYVSFGVQVEREQSLLSSVTLASDQNLNMFAYGDGSTENPYRISTADNLLNISIKPSSNFEIISSIDLSDIDIVARLNKFGAVICEDFQGSLTSNENYVIYGIQNLNLTNQSSFALFKTLSNAKISNLTFGRNDVHTIITNSFNANTSKELHMAVIATNAENSTLSNIVINRTQIVLNGNGQLNGAVYVGGVVANTQNSNLNGCNVELDVQFDVVFASYAHFGGLISTATNTNITKGEHNNSVTFKLTQQSFDSTITSVGGAVGQFVGNNARTYEISDTNTSVDFDNVYATYLGGLVGASIRGTINNCATSGRIRVINAGNTQIGGVTGLGQSSHINYSGTSIQFDVTVNDLSYATYVGALSGVLSTVSNLDCVANYCYSTYQVSEQTTVSTTGITLGKYGRSTQNGVSITNWQNRG